MNTLLVKRSDDERLPAT